MSSSGVRRIYGLLNPSQRRRGAVVLLIMVIAALVQVAGVGSLHPFLSVVANPDAIRESKVLSIFYTTFGFSSITSFTLALGGAVVGLILVSNIVLALSDWLRLRYQWGLHHSISTRLMESYLGRDFAYYLGKNTSELNKNVLAEAENLTNSVVDPTLQFLSRATATLALAGLLLWFEPILTVAVLVLLGGAYLLIYMGIRRRAQRRGAEYVQANTERYKASQEALSGIREVKVLGAERFFLDRYRGPSERYSRTRAIHRLYMQLPQYLIETMAFSTLTLLILVLFARGAAIDTLLPTIGLFAFAGYRMMPALRDMLAAVTTYRFHTELIRVISDDLEAGGHSARDDDQETAPAVRPASGPVGIEFSCVSYTYPDAPAPALQNVDARIEPHTTVAFVGQTGAGKTTILNLLLGLVQPQEGSILVNGRELAEGLMPWWRDRLGFVPQDIFLMDDTVERNIALGIEDRNIDQAAVRRAARQAHIHDFIAEELPRGYETRVGENGVRLSGGQRQRLGIARALYRDPDVLVLDEATSDIDSITEARITRALQEQARERTVIVVAHRLNTIRSCQRIFLLSGGRIVAAGTYSALASESTAFQEMLTASEGGGLP